MQTFQVIQGDLVLGGNSFVTITGQQKTLQDLTMALLEPYLSDPYHPGWGSVLQNYVGQPSTHEMTTLIKSEINRVISNRQRIQLDIMNRAATNGQPNPFGVNEIIAGIQSINLVQNLDFIAASVGIVTASNTEVQISVGVQAS